MSIKYGVIGRNIHDARKRMNITQEKAAELFDISLQYYGKLERGEREISLKRLAEASEHFNVSIEELIEGAVIPTDGFIPNIQAVSGNADFIEAMQGISKGCSAAALRLMLNLCAAVAADDKTRDSH